jgi:hypothetical protein
MLSSQSLGPHGATETQRGIRTNWLNDSREIIHLRVREGIFRMASVAVLTESWPSRSHRDTERRVRTNWLNDLRDIIDRSLPPCSP